MGRCPSGQREQTVNLPVLPTVVRIHPGPPVRRTRSERIFGAPAPACQRRRLPLLRRAVTPRRRATRRLLDQRSSILSSKPLPSDGAARWPTAVEVGLGSHVQARAMRPTAGTPWARSSSPARTGPANAGSLPLADRRMLLHRSVLAAVMRLRRGVVALGLAFGGPGGGGRGVDGRQDGAPADGCTVEEGAFSRPSCSWSRPCAPDAAARARVALCRRSVPAPGQGVGEGR